MIKPNTSGLLRRKDELDETRVNKPFYKQPKTVVKNLKSNYGKYHREWYSNRRH